jgi:hypothetical protein
MSRKKLKIIAKERNEPLHNDYMQHMAQYSSEQLGFLDKTSKNDKTPGNLPRNQGEVTLGRMGKK